MTNTQKTEGNEIRREMALLRAENLILRKVLQRVLHKAVKKGVQECTFVYTGKSLIFKASEYLEEK